MLCSWQSRADKIPARLEGHVHTGKSIKHVSGAHLKSVERPLIFHNSLLVDRGLSGSTNTRAHWQKLEATRNRFYCQACYTVHCKGIFIGRGPACDPASLSRPIRLWILEVSMPLGEAGRRVSSIPQTNSHLAAGFAFPELQSPRDCYLRCAGLPSLCFSK